VDVPADRVTNLRSRITLPLQRRKRLAHRRQVRHHYHSLFGPARQQFSVRTEGGNEREQRPICIQRDRMLLPGTLEQTPRIGKEQLPSLGREALIQTVSTPARLLATNVIDEVGQQQFFGYDANRNRVLTQDKNVNRTQYVLPTYF